MAQEPSAPQSAADRRRHAVEAVWQATVESFRIRSLDVVTKRLAAAAPSPAVGVAVGVACAMLSLLLRFAAKPFIGDGEALLTAFPLVLVASLAAGHLGGWTCLVLCTIGSWYLFIGERFSFELGPHEAGILIGTFLAGTFVIQICVLMRRAFWEIDDLRTAERLMSRELEHRIKNTLTLVLSIARQTFRAGRTVEPALADFEGRLVALAAAQDIVTGKGIGKAAQISQIVERSLAPFCGGAAHERLTVSGPCMAVDDDVTVGLFLIFHELATNAAKYGALSNDRGTVRVTWCMLGDAQDRLHLTWIESEGPPVAMSGRQGFGTKLVNRIVTRNLRGAIEVAYPVSGVRADVTLPLTR